MAKSPEQRKTRTASSRYDQTDALPKKDVLARKHHPSGWLYGTARTEAILQFRQDSSSMFLAISAICGFAACRRVQLSRKRICKNFTSADTDASGAAYVTT